MTKLLLIEPDRMLASIYFDALSAAGCEVIYAAGAQLAILVADQIQPDLIVLELQLIEHSGIEFLYELRSYADWQKVPVIINSVVPPREFNNSYKLLKKELGVVDYLYKPSSTLKTLVAAVNKVSLSKV